MIATPFEPEHLALINLQESQQCHAKYFTLGYGRQLKKAGPAFTLSNNGKVILCSGLAYYWEGRAEMWAILDKDAGSQLLQATRMAKKAIEAYAVKRLEIIVRAGDTAGERWAKMLGFKLEGEEMASFYPDGSGASRYVRFS